MNINHKIMTITNITLILTFITLVVVAFQTYYTKKALDKAKESIELAKTSRQLEGLPQISYIIHVNLFLNKWNEELKEISMHLENNNEKEILKRSKRRINKEGLIDKYFYDKMPSWLSIMYETGAQYYYSSSCNYPFLLEIPEARNAYIERFKESSYNIEILLKYIEEEIPEVFLNCPVSERTSSFFEKR